MPTYIIPFTKSPSRQNPATFSADMDSRLSEENSRIIAMNAQSVENNTAVTSTSTAAANALAYSNNAATSAAAAAAAANRAQSVVIPTTAAYAIATQDWRDTMMSKSEFNAVAAERRANRAGSGFDEFGKSFSAATSVINEGMWVISTSPNNLRIGLTGATVGTSKTDNPYVSINGVISKVNLVGEAVNQNFIHLPPAPTVLPSTATLTQQQIDSGVIKHADASNSGLIVNGKFDTDTAGWTGTNTTLSVVSNQLVVAGTAVAPASQRANATTFNTIIGKKYIVEFNLISNTGTSDSSVGVLLTGGTFDVNGLGYYYNNIVGRYQYIFTATETTIIVMLQAGNLVGVISTFDNISVFPSDAISRSDLVFLESWHEDVSEKDFVYPLGNVQYLGTTGDSGTPVAGSFAGSATYSLFSDTWQADSALIGKGYVWSTLSDANKKAFVANPENNCYLDGDKVIQVRYRMRVVMGLGDSWQSVDTQTKTFLAYDNGTYSRVQAKGKLVTQNDLSSLSTLQYLTPATGTYTLNIPLSSYGIYQGGSVAGSTDIGYDKQCYAIPIALVHRRNQGGYDLTYNPNGTKAMTMTPTIISDCFTEANYTAITGYIGTSTSRPDGLFFDQVSIEDFKPSNKGADLRNTSKKRTAHEIIQEFAPKVIAGTLIYNNNDTTALTTYKDEMEVRDTSGNRYGMVSKAGNVVTIGSAVANKKGFTVVTQNAKQYLQVADDAASDATVQMNLSTIKYDIGVFDA